MEIFKEFTFEAAHFLPNLPSDHKCSRLHGHSYGVQIYISGEIHSSGGWVIDFHDISAAFEELHDQLDHRLLNEIEGLDNPTAENIAKWIWVRLIKSLPNMSKLMIRETSTSGAIYRGENS